MKFLIISGPNLNMLGLWKPEIYGKGTYSELTTYLWKEMKSREIDCIFYQSNFEGAIVEKIQQAYGRIDGIIICPTTLARNGYAVADSIEAVGIPAMEVHFAASPAASVISPVCTGTVSGKGAQGYLVAAELLLKKIGE